jgi:hypothetical protein
VDLERALVSAKLAPERDEMVETARHLGREPAARFVLRLIELDRQIDIAHLERAACVGAKNPDFAHPRHVPTLATHEALDKSADPLRRLRAFHRARLMRERKANLHRAECGSSVLRCQRLVDSPCLLANIAAYLLRMGWSLSRARVNKE